MASEVRFLWEQNRSLKEQLAQGSRGNTTLHTTHTTAAPGVELC